MFKTLRTDIFLNKIFGSFKMLKQNINWIFFAFCWVVCLVVFSDWVILKPKIIKSEIILLAKISAALWASILVIGLFF